MSQNQPFFSIIMPVYNAQAYLEQAINSIIKQSYSSFELILIDDCSTDNSKEICQRLQGKDERIKFLCLSKNSGPACARNTGIHLAVGKYLGFVDSDDYIDEDLFEIVHTALLVGDIDCLKFGLIEEYYDSKGEKINYRNVCRIETGDFHSADAIKKQIVNLEMIPLFGYLCNGFYRRDIVESNHLSLDETFIVNEDFNFNIRFFKCVNFLKCIDYHGYHYAKRHVGSLSSQRGEYSYQVNMYKIRALLGLFASSADIPTAIKQKIFWLYTRFVYSSLVNMIGKVSELWAVIQRDPLFSAFLVIRFDNFSKKKKLMIALLKMRNIFVLSIFIVLIRKIQKDCPILFAKFKR